MSKHNKWAQSTAENTHVLKPTSFLSSLYIAKLSTFNINSLIGGTVLSPPPPQIYGYEYSALCMSNCNK